MAQRAAFGRRAASKPVHRPVRAMPPPERQEPVFGDAPSAPLPAQISEIPTTAPSIDAEIAEWNEARKARKRSFREPWRSVSIAATLMFGLGTWLLPDSVATIVQILLFALGAASFYAGWRRPR